MDFHRINKVYKKDLKRIIKNPVAIIVIIGICILPSLYAWVNIKACWNVYENTQNIPIAVVNNDADTYFKGEKINIGNQIVEQLKGNKKIRWVFTTTSDADLGVMDSTYYAAIEIPSDFSTKLLTFLSDNPQKPEIIYKVDTKANPVAGKIASSANNSLVQQVTSEFINTVNKTVYDYINEAGETVGSDKEDLLKLKDSIVMLNRNMDTITDSLSSIGTESGNLGDLLDSIDASMPYVQSSLNAIGKMNSDNQRILENTQDSMDRSLKNIDMSMDYAKTSNSKLSALFATLSDATADANSAKINTTIPLISAQLTSLNSSVDATITYLEQCRDNDFSGDINTAISDLQKLRTALTELRAALVQMQTSVAALHTDVDKLYDALETNLPALKSAITNLDSSLETVITDLKALDAVTPNPELEAAIAALQQINTSKIGDSLSKLLDDILADRAEVDKALTDLSASIASTITQTDGAIKKVDDAIVILQKLATTDTANRKQELNNIIADLSAIKPYVSDEQTQLATIRSQLLSANSIAKSSADLVNNDCKKIANQLDNAIRSYDSDVKQDLKTIGDNLVVSVKGAGELIKTAQELGKQITDMIKTAKEGTELSAEFSGDLNKKLQQFKTVISSLGGKLEGLGNGDILNIISIMQNDPTLMGEYISNPFDINEESIYTIPNYGTGMAPIYTTLALWVGCLVLNAILRSESAWFNGIEKLTLREKHFGKMLLFITCAAAQGLIVSLGNIYLLKIYVVNPPMFVFFSVYSSIVFSIITFTLLSTLGDVGKALGIIYLILQVAGSGGSYPIQVDPSIFRILQPLFPFTYTLSGLREAIAGPLSAAVTTDVLLLSAFAALFLVGGYFTVGPLHRTFHKFELGFRKSGLGE